MFKNTSPITLLYHPMKAPPQTLQMHLMTLYCLILYLRYEDTIEMHQCLHIHSLPEKNDLFSVWCFGRQIPLLGARLHPCSMLTTTRM